MRSSPSKLVPAFRRIAEKPGLEVSRDISEVCYINVRSMRMTHDGKFMTVDVTVTIAKFKGRSWRESDTEVCPRVGADFHFRGARA